MTDKELLELSAKAAGYCVDTAFDDGPEAATRRAIVRAAAEIGKQTN